MSTQETRGTVTKILPVEEISGGKYKKLTFSIVNNDGYNGKQKLLAFTIFEKCQGNRIDRFLDDVEVGSDVVVSFEIETKEFGGRYFTTLSAVRVAPVRASSAAHQAPTREATKIVDEILDEEPPF